MPTSARKLNFMIRNEIARELEALVPAGERSRTVNDALAKELLAIRRRMITFYDAVYHAVAYLRKAGRRGGVALLRDFIPA